jgi:hypothetical protein
MLSIASKAFCLLRARPAEAVIRLRSLAVTSEPILPKTQARDHELYRGLAFSLRNQDVTGLWKGASPVP